MHQPDLGKFSVVPCDKTLGTLLCPLQWPCDHIGKDGKFVLLPSFPVLKVHDPIFSWGKDWWACYENKHEWISRNNRPPGSNGAAGDRKESVLVTESTSYIKYVPSLLEVVQKKACSPFCSKLAPKDCKGLLLEFPQASALVSVCCTNKYYVANVPIWQGREKKSRK